MPTVEVEVEDEDDQFEEEKEYENQDEFEDEENQVEFIDENADNTPDFACPDAGFYTSPSDCSQYYLCTADKTVNI